MKHGFFDMKHDFGENRAPVFFAFRCGLTQQHTKFDEFTRFLSFTFHNLMIYCNLLLV